MADAPERIWATASDDGWLAPYCGLFPCKGATEYIRADLAPTDAQVMAHPKVRALVEALRALLDSVDAWAETVPGSDEETAATGPISEAAEFARASLAAMEGGNG